MKLKKFLKNIKKAVKENPELLDATVVYAIDDEGNAFHKVRTDPTPGSFVKGEFECDGKPSNAICIN